MLALPEPAVAAVAGVRQRVQPDAGSRPRRERKPFLETVADYYRLAKSLHPGRLVLSNDGYVMRPTDLVSHFGGGLADLPVVKHEFGEYLLFAARHLSRRQVHRRHLPRVAGRRRDGGSRSRGSRTSTAQYIPKLPAAPATRPQIPESNACGSGRTSPATTTGSSSTSRVERVRATPGRRGGSTISGSPRVSPRDGQAINSAVLPLIATGVERPHAVERRDSKGRRHCLELRREGSPSTPRCRGSSWPTARFSRRTRRR